ncbi:secretion protein EccK [Mycobacterium sp. SMC-4]|uniref:secretion protein EccK n=1 Tax=Mycobacterium sp. SMC-4 TaxID=2857059 RepID=UPI003D0252BB
MPLGPPTTPAPPAPVPPGAPAGGAAPAVPAGGPGVAPAATSAASSTAGPAPVPVSAARAERDAVATAATAGALRRQHQGNDPTQLARRIAAALNVNIFDFGFYWVTGLTTDGTIVVANSYGIGYIPANVRLPQGVQMATADESIPATDRARWATYPILAVQGWTQHHNQRLRVVIATEDQFQGFDAGVAKIVLQPDDMPEDGTMQGRTRLEILAPGAASTLSATRDDELSKLLPVAQTDSTAPEDKSAALWFEVCKPLMSTSTARVNAHLEAMRTYSDHAMQLALHKAQTATDATEQRAAIADWVYWQHESSIIAEAMETATASS